MTMRESEPAAPHTVAVIDIGANSVRMEIAEISPEGETAVMERMQQPVRLGRDAFVYGELRQETISATIAILRDYRRLLDTYRVTSVHTVATSAVREAKNAEPFLDRVARTVGFDVDIIEPSEQCRLIVTAVRHDLKDALDLSRRTVLVAEVGGGNTLLSVLRSGEITASQSYDLGAIRMQEMLATAQEQPVRAAELLRHHIANTVDEIRKSMQLHTIGTFIAVGGDARFVASQVGQPMAEGRLEAISADKLEKFLAQAVPATTEELARRFQLSFAHAETLVPALLVYQALLEQHAGAAGAGLAGVHARRPVAGHSSLLLRPGGPRPDAERAGFRGDGGREVSIRCGACRARGLHRHSSLRRIAARARALALAPHAAARGGAAPRHRRIHQQPRASQAQLLHHHQYRHLRNPPQGYGADRASRALSPAQRAALRSRGLHGLLPRRSHGDQQAGRACCGWRTRWTAGIGRN